MRDNSRQVRTATNAGWLSLQSIITMLLGAGLTAVAARVYGPEILGQFNYSMALVTLFTAVATLGLEPTIIRDLVAKNYSEGSVLRTSLLLRGVTGLAVIGLSTGLARVLQDDPVVNVLVLLLSLSLAARVSDVYLYWLKANQLMRQAALLKIVSISVTSMARLIVLLTGQSIVWYAFFYVVESMVYAALLWLSVRRRRAKFERGAISSTYLKALLKAAKYLTFAGLATSIYNRIDQIMIGSMIEGTRAVGLYAAAAALAELWYFIPVAAITSLQPLLFGSLGRPQFGQITRALFAVVIVLSLLFAVLVSVFSDLIIGVLYGDRFAAAGPPLIVLAWAGVLAMLGTAQASWFVAMGLERYVLSYTFFGALVNVALNFVAIPNWGLMGAAMASLLSQFAVVLLAPLFFRRTRPVIFDALSSLSPGHLKDVVSVLSGLLVGRKKG